MDYQKLHDQIIKRGKTRIICSPCERHHIVPKCMGGTNNLENIVKLTSREHFIIHKILCKLYPDVVGLKIAWKLLSDLNNHNRRNSRFYANIRTTMIEISKSPERRRKISESLKGKKKPPRTAEHSAKIIASRPKTQSPSHIKNRTKKLIGQKRSAEQIERFKEIASKRPSNNRNNLLGNKLSQKTKILIGQKNSIALKGKPWSEARRKAYELRYL